jgi:hypothetical protein
MKYIVTESQIQRLIESIKKRPAKRIGDKLSSDEKRPSNQIEDKPSFYDEIRGYLREYITGGCVKFDVSHKYIIVDVGAPYDFVDAGFEREDANRVKNKLRSKGFNSLGLGQFVKEI